MKKVLLTGCCGFIGSHLTEKLLNDGFSIVGIDNFDPFYDKNVKLRNLSLFQNHPNFRFFEADLGKVDFGNIIQDDFFDAVIHLAAKTGVQPSLHEASSYVETNIAGTVNLLNYMRTIGCKKFLFTSSSSVYGNNSSVPFRESDEVNHPISPYAFTKRACELANYSYHHLFNIDVINLRLFTVYGPRQRPDLAIHKFVRLISSGKSIQMYGDGSTARDYTFIKDTVQGFRNALDYLLGNEKIFEILNLGNNHPVKLSELIDIIGEEMGTIPKVDKIATQPGDVDITFADISKAQRMIGYSPATDIREGIREFVNWYNSKS